MSIAVSLTLNDFSQALRNIQDQVDRIADERREILQNDIAQHLTNSVDGLSVEQQDGELFFTAPNLHDREFGDATGQGDAPLSRALNSFVREV